MAKHLPDPPGKPDPAAQAIIDQIHAYCADAERNPVATTGGMRHIYHAAELAWDGTVAHAKDQINPDTGRKYAFRSLQEVTGGALGTLQGRIRAHEDRVAAT